MLEESKNKAEKKLNEVNEQVAPILLVTFFFSLVLEFPILTVILNFLSFQWICLLKQVISMSWRCFSLDLMWIEGCSVSSSLNS